MTPTRHLAIRADFLIQTLLVRSCGAVPGGWEEGAERHLLRGPLPGGVGDNGPLQGSQPEPRAGCGCVPAQPEPARPCVKEARPGAGDYFRKGPWSLEPLGSAEAGRGPVLPAGPAATLSSSALFAELVSGVLSALN